MRGRNLHGPGDVIEPEAQKILNRPPFGDLVAGDLEQAAILLDDIAVRFVGEGTRIRGAVTHFDLAVAQSQARDRVGSGRAVRRCYPVPHEQRIGRQFACGQAQVRP